MSLIKRFYNDDNGATAIEYGLVAAILGLGVIAGYTAVIDAWNVNTNNVVTALK